MSNKAISMCPDQGPRVLTRVISPGSPACATSSSETDPPPPPLPPLSILPPLLPGRHSAHHVTILSPPPPPSPKRRRREKSTTKRERTRVAKLQRGEKREGGRGEKALSSPVQPASKGNFHKGSPLLMNVI